MIVPRLTFDLAACQAGALGLCAVRWHAEARPCVRGQIGPRGKQGAGRRRGGADRIGERREETA